MGYKHEGKDRQLDSLFTKLDLISAAAKIDKPLTRAEIEQKALESMNREVTQPVRDAMKIITNVLNNHPFITKADEASIEAIPTINSPLLEITPEPEILGGEILIPKHFVSARTSYANLMAFMDSVVYRELVRHKGIQLIGVVATPDMTAKRVLSNYLKGLSRLVPNVEDSNQKWFEAVRGNPFFADY